MFSTIQNRKQATSWQKKYDQHAPRAGDEAPDFALRDVTGKKEVRLSQFRGKKPVVLIFGSFT